MVCFDKAISLILRLIWTPGTPWNSKPQNFQVRGPLELLGAPRNPHNPIKEQVHEGKNSHFLNFSYDFFSFLGSIGFIGSMGSMGSMGSIGTMGSKEHIDIFL